jgi:hypothetical protein
MFLLWLVIYLSQSIVANLLSFMLLMKPGWHPQTCLGVLLTEKTAFSMNLLVLFVAPRAIELQC